MLNLAITVHKHDNIHARIESEDFDFLTLMAEFFSFFADGYKFHPAFRNHSWDGKIRLYNISTGLIPLGLAHDVVDFCHRHNKQVFLDPQISTVDIDRDQIQTFVDSLDVHTGGESIDPYDYQVDSVIYALEQKRSILLSPTSSGKSLIQYILCRIYQTISPDKKILMIVPNTGLVTQMTADFDDYSSEIEWDAKSNISSVSKGKIQDESAHIVITTYQSLSNKKTMPDHEFFEQFEYIMVDEVHTATAKSIIAIMNKCVNADNRVGLTGTLAESKTNEMTLKGMFGNVMTVITTRELMDRGAVACLKVNCGLLNYPDHVKKFMRSADRGDTDGKGNAKKTKCSYPEEISYLCASEERNTFIMNLAVSLEGNTIVMIKEIAHGENLYKWMTEAYPDRNIYLYNGDTDKDERELIRQRMETEENSIIIGSLGVLSTGISIKRLHNMIFCHPSKSRVKVLQSVGRLLRKSKFGNFVTMFDLVDDFSIGSYENYTLLHGRDRVRYYHDQQFDYDTTIIDIDVAKE